MTADDPSVEPLSWLTTWWMGAMSHLANVGGHAGGVDDRGPGLHVRQSGLAVVEREGEESLCARW